MSRCEECGQDKPVTDEQVLAFRLDCYRAAFGVMRELWNKEPGEFQVMGTARFLATESPVIYLGDDREDADDD